MDNQGEETPIFYLYSDLVKLNPGWPTISKIIFKSGAITSKNQKSGDSNYQGSSVLTHN